MDYIEKKVLPTEADVVAATEAKELEQPVTQTAEPQKAAEPLTAQEAPVLNVKPASLNWMSDDEYNEVSKYIPAERINQIYNGFDPKSSEPIYQTIYKSTHKTPEVPDERKEKAARTIAGVTDALKLLVQGVSGAKGAYIPKDERPGALEATSDKLKKLRDLYKTDRERYESGLYQSTLADLENARKGYNTDRATLLGVLNSLRSQKTQRDINEARLRYQAEKDKANMDFKEREAKANADYRKDRLNIDRQNAFANMVRANKADSSSGSAKKGEVEFFDANTGKTYTVKEKKFKYNAPQMFEILKDDILASDEKLSKQYKRSKGKITLQEQEDAVKKYMYNNPKAMKFLESISDNVDQEKSLLMPALSEQQISTIDNFISRSEGDENSAIRDIAIYLSSEGLDDKSIASVIKKIKV